MHLMRDRKTHPGSILAAVTGLLLLPLLAGCGDELNREVLREEMAALDQTWIPALVTTQQGDRAQAELATEAFRAQWDIFRVKFRDFPADDPHWSARLDSLDSLVDETVDFVETGESLERAQTRLEEMRHAFRRLRHAIGIEDYFLDHVTEYHDDLEMITGVVEERPEGTITPGLMDSLATMLDGAEEHWDVVSELRFDQEAFDLDIAAMNRLANLVREHREALQRMRTALQEGARAQIRTRASELRETYLLFFKVFGDFSPITS
ncbi:MAG: hypothetical protein R6W82_09545 [bacterium]